MLRTFKNFAATSQIRKNANSSSFISWLRTRLHDHDSTYTILLHVLHKNPYRKCTQERKKTTCMQLFSPAAFHDKSQKQTKSQSCFHVVKIKNEIGPVLQLKRSAILSEKNSVQGKVHCTCYVQTHTLTVQQVTKGTCLTTRAIATRQKSAFARACRTGSRDFVGVRTSLVAMGYRSARHPLALRQYTILK